MTDRARAPISYMRFSTLTLSPSLMDSDHVSAITGKHRCLLCSNFFILSPLRFSGVCTSCAAVWAWRQIFDRVFNWLLACCCRLSLSLGLPLLVTLGLPLFSLCVVLTFTTHTHTFAGALRRLSRRRRLLREGGGGGRSQASRSVCGYTQIFWSSP